MSISAGVGEAIRQLVIANEQSSDPWHFYVFVQNQFSHQDIPSELSNAFFTHFRGKYLLPMLQAWRASKRGHADCIVATDFRLFLIALIAWVLNWRSPRRASFWINSVPLVIDGWVKRLIFRFVAARSNLIFASTAIRNEHSYAWHRGRSQVVLYGIPDHGIRAKSIKRKKPIVLQYTGAFVAWKNHRTLLHAIAKVIKAVPMIELRLLGDGKTKPEMERLADDLKIARFVNFMGRRSDARELLQECDLYVHPSLGEGLGIAVVEAMFARLPIIAADSGAFPEYLEHDSTALLVDCEDDGQALAEAILEMLERIEDGRAMKMGELAYLDATNCFGTSRYIEEWKTAVDLGNR